MLNREDIRKVLTARKMVIDKYNESGLEKEDVPFRNFLEDVLKEYDLLFNRKEVINKNENKN